MRNVRHYEPGKNASRSTVLNAFYVLFFRFIRPLYVPYLRFKLRCGGILRVNIGAGEQKIPGYCGIDVDSKSDVVLNLAMADLPFVDASLDAAVCMSAINYFTRARAQKIIAETYRVLKYGGVARFGVQDLESIAQRYVNKDKDFFFQKLPNGRERFEGPTLGDKFAAWFYGYIASGVPCQYFYDYDSLAYLFREAGFSIVERKYFRQSQLDHIELIDNRPDQMFFLEAVK